ncbi:MAG: BREX-1 system adenine-specific DNA-methyltransferase PglX, partial [Bacteroidales bacterium]|nr:BREX-1 system adenine-specific DNA-methyltransferase PglX [Bacteroidales bacterium]
MNKNNLKRYSRQARIDFINAVTQKASLYGIRKNKAIIPCEEKGDFCLIGENFFPKSVYSQRAQLAEQVQQKGFDQTIEEIAYQWFNRFAAIRFMELKGYLSHGYRVMSHPADVYDPEILEKAHFIEKLDGLTRDEIVKLKLDGKNDELYQKLILAQCNELHQVMPFLFEKINDYTELLMPDNLLRNDSLIRKMVNEIPEEDWQSVEIIGWLYQFYISEKKDVVIGSKKPIKTEDIPAATQLFTPNWIVKYLIQNSLGAKWLATNPKSSLKKQMRYYIEPAEQEPEVVEEIKRITPSYLNPEEIKVMDPACGSGHMLVEAYNLLKSIYLERGYQIDDIGRLILEKNLFGLEIDERAAQLSGFALIMKAREDSQNIFKDKDKIEINITCIQSSKPLNFNDLLRNLESIYTGKYSATPSEKYKYMGIADGPLFADKGMPEDKNRRANFVLKIIKKTLDLFTEADTFGSLIRVSEEIGKYLPEIIAELENLTKNADMISRNAIDTILPFLKQAEYLYQKYDVVIANPPYMGHRNMNQLLKSYIGKQFKGFEKDLFSSFIIRCRDFASSKGYLGFMSPFVWMFISSYEKMRLNLIDSATLTSLIQLEYSGFSGATVPICTFTFLNNHIKNYTSSYIKLSDFRGAANQSPKTLEAIENKNCGWFYNTKADGFKKIPGSPIAYWASERVRKIFYEGTKIVEIFDIKQGMATSDNNRFLRFWHEVSLNNIKFDCQSLEESGISYQKWYPYNKGGYYRRWYGNNEYVVNWWQNGKELKEFQSNLSQGWHVRLKSREFYFKPSINWSFVSSAFFGVRYSFSGFIFDVGGSAAFPIEK